MFGLYFAFLSYIYSVYEVLCFRYKVEDHVIEYIDILQADFVSFLHFLASNHVYMCNSFVIFYVALLFEPVGLHFYVQMEEKFDLK